MELILVRKVFKSQKRSLVVMGGVEFSVGYAHDLPYPDESMDVVFLPMVLQWVPRKKLMKSISEIDRVSKGFLILSEFLPDFPSWSYSKHNEMVKIFKQDYRAIFDSLPWWRTLKNEVFNITEGTDFQRSVTILRKLSYSKGYTQRGSVSEKQNPAKLKKV
ncbi:MAG: methyltransferase domain-containing protein [Candidatus Marinimicrobia bacterium]|nr:methyltransferase domain-containing protein [Candidatus Neomarinimicrobiota bacterium]